MPIYSCQITANAAALDVYLNGYHLYSSLGANHSYSTNLRAWMEEVNLFRFKLSPSTRATEGEPIQFALEANAVEGTSTQNLASMSFPLGVAAPDIASVPFDSLGKALKDRHSLAFACPDIRAIVEKPWNATDKLLINAREIYELYGEIQSAFVDGNLSSLMALSQARITFGAKLNDQRRSEFESRVQRNLESTIARRPRWKTTADPARELTVHEFFPGKVMRVLDLHGNPPLRTVADANGVQTGYDIILGMTKEGLSWVM